MVKKCPLRNGMKQIRHPETGKCVFEEEYKDKKIGKVIKLTERGIVTLNDVKVSARALELDPKNVKTVRVLKKLGKDLSRIAKQLDSVSEEEKPTLQLREVSEKICGFPFDSEAKLVRRRAKALQGDIDRAMKQTSESGNRLLKTLGLIGGGLLLANVIADQSVKYFERKKKEKDLSELVQFVIDEGNRDNQRIDDKQIQLMKRMTDLQRIVAGLSTRSVKIHKKARDMKDKMDRIAGVLSELEKEWERFSDRVDVIVEIRTKMKQEKKDDTQLTSSLAEAEVAADALRDRYYDSVSKTEIEIRKMIDEYSKFQEEIERFRDDWRSTKQFVSEEADAIRAAAQEIQKEVNLSYVIHVDGMKVSPIILRDLEQSLERINNKFNWLSDIDILASEE